MKINNISPQDKKYLQIISTIANAPKKLYYVGTIPEQRLPTVAIVGTRKPSRYGNEVTHQLSYDLAKRGVVIVSGLALGVDGIAHRAALQAGGITIAVQANGLSQISPSTHRQLGIDIIQNNGLIVSAYEPHVTARKFQFLDRNRIVSGLSDAIIITEAASRSGTLNTAMHALDQGRTVFVVPGNITSPLSAGCNTLLKQGATPVTCAQDILEVIAPSLLQPQTSLALGDTPLESAIITLLQQGIRDGEVLHQQSGASAAEFSMALTMMEINGVIRGLGGNQWTLV